MNEELTAKDIQPFICRLKTLIVYCFVHFVAFVGHRDASY